MSKLLEQINTTPSKTSKLVDFAIINPAVRLERGKEYPFLDMSEVKALTRIPELSNKKIFIGSGSKFEKGDTLFARITPCLENGKITRVLNIDTPAFGSTEFIVLRGKDGVSDNDFIYYLAQTYKLRKKAEQSMVGASGRQRVDRVAFENIPVSFPNLPIQKKIAEILSAYDTKIENNNKIIKNLEATAQTIFNEWFINFRFPGSDKVEMVDSNMGEIPEGWEVSSLGKVSDNHDSKRIPLSSMERNKRKGSVPYYGANGILDYIDESIFSGEYLLFAEDGTVKTSRNTPVIYLVDGDFWVNNHAHIISGNKVSNYFLYLSLCKINVDQYITGGVQPKITQQNLNSIPVLLPEADLLTRFEKIINPIKNKIKMLEKENVKLKESRDQLLAKLI